MKVLIALAVAAAGLAMAAPAFAAGKTTIVTPEDWEHSRFTRIGILAWHDGKQGHVRMTVNRPTGGWASYQAKGTVKRDRIRAKFGRFGEVDLRFKERSVRWHDWITYERCTYAGSGGVGFLQGQVRYSGEGNLKPLKTRNFRRVALRARGKGRECVPVKPYIDPADPGAIRLTARNAQGGLQLDAFQPGFFHAQGYVLVRSRESVGKVAIRRVLYSWFFAKGMVGRKLIADSADALTLQEFAPFHGTADFVRTSPEGGTWLGNYRVGLPGRPGVGLAGPDWTAQVGFPNR